MTDPSSWPLLVMFGVAVGSVGVEGCLVLAAPSVAKRYIFLGSTGIRPYLRILGALWLALGSVAILGLLDPLKFSAILLVQFIYKSARLIVAAYRRFSPAIENQG